MREPLPTTAADTSAESSRPLGELEQKLIPGFIAEAFEHVDLIEASVLQLESHLGDATILDTILGSFHTIKGGAGLLDIRSIGALAHAAEEVLEAAREGKLALNPDLVDLILESADRTRVLVGGLQASGGLTLPLAADPLSNDLTARLRSCARLKQEVAPSDRSIETGGESDVTVDPALDEIAEVMPPSDAPVLSSGDGVVKITTERLDKLIDLVGELVVAELMVRDSVQADPSDDPLPTRRLNQLARITRELYDLSVAVRMMPIQGTFQRMARVARDLARKTGKELEVRVSGGATELDRKLIEAIGDPLLHMVRNALDHGLESPDARQLQGKPRSGIITFDARHEAGEVLIELSDDGAGLDRERIVEKAREMGLVHADVITSDDEVFNLIFHPGLSTARQVTDLSGRGVGMDVVKRNIEALRGRIRIRTASGKGTSFQIRLPLTLALIDVLVVRVGVERYLLPLTCIEESLQPTDELRVNAPQLGQICLVRGKPLPLVSLHNLFDVPRDPGPAAEPIAVVVRDRDDRCCLLVDELLGQERVVLKSLSSALGKAPGISGGAVLGDGKITLLLDIPSVFDLVGAAAAGVLA